MILAESGGMNFICSNQKCAAPLHIWQFWVYHITEIGLQSVERPPREPYCCLSTLVGSCHITFRQFAFDDEPTKIRQDHYDCLPTLATNKRYSEYE